MQSLNPQTLDLLPGLHCVHGLDSAILSCCTEASKILGFKNSDQIQGRNYENLNCDAAHDANVFKAQDQYVFKNKSSYRFLSYLPFASNGLSLVMGEKKPLLDEYGNVVALISAWNDITSEKLIDISRFINFAKPGLCTSHQHAFVYHLQNQNDINQHNLTNREMQCLFYLLRGYNTREIGTLLFLSHRTVEDHVTKLRYKLNSTSKSELIQTAIHYGYMNILPESILKFLTT